MKCTEAVIYGKYFVNSKLQICFKMPKLNVNSENSV